MFKTFMAEFKNLMKSKWRIAGYILLLFIPLIYGFTTMNAFWKPFHHVDRLKVAVVNLDKSVYANELDDYLENKKETKLGSQTFKINIQDASSIYKSRDEAKKAVDNGDYDALIVIPLGYGNAIHQVENAVIAGGSSLLLAPANQLASDITKILSGHQVEFMNSFKHNFLAGEITNMAISVDDFVKNALTHSMHAKSFIKNIFTSMKDKVIQHEVIGKDINVYGKGFSPFFIAISLWAGALAGTFIIKNQRFIKDQGTFKHYFGKTLVWLVTGWIQATLLTLAISAQGVVVEGDWGNQWRLWFAIMAISTLFTLTIQGISSMVRFGDIGEFIIVVFMVINLVASAGTFPAFMQNKFFHAINPYLPFTYSVSLVREALYDPQPMIIMKDLLILAIYPKVFMLLALGINYLYDQHTVKIIDNRKIYRSLEQHTGDL